MQCYLAEKIAQLKCQKCDDGPVLTIMALTIDVNWVRAVPRKKIS